MTYLRKKALNDEDYIRVLLAVHDLYEDGKRTLAVDIYRHISPDHYSKTKMYDLLFFLASTFSREEGALRRIPVGKYTSYKLTNTGINILATKFKEMSSYWHGFIKAHLKQPHLIDGLDHEFKNQKEMAQSTTEW